MADTTVIGNKLGEENVARNVNCKGNKITKISMITDLNGTPLDASIYPGSKHDSTIYLDQLDDKSLVNRNLEVKHRGILLADKGYDSSKIRNKLTKKCFTPTVPFNKRNTKDKGKIKHQCGKHNKIYKSRILIEQTLMKLKKKQEISVRYDRKTITYKGFVMLAVIDIIQKST
jgi:transposase